MLATCRTRLVAGLVAAGVPETHVLSSAAQAKQFQAAPWALVAVGPDQLHRDGSLVGRWIVGTTSHHRRRLYRRTLAFAVHIGASSEDAADALMTGLLQAMPGKFQDAGGNPVRITQVVPTWAQEESLLRQLGTSVLSGFRFEGGVYQDTTRPVVNQVKPVPAGLMEEE